MQSIHKIWKQRKSLYEYFAGLDSISQVHMEVGDIGISITLDGEETLWKWSSFSYAHMDDRRISLRGESRLILPAKSMASEDYARLKTVVSQKIIESDQD